MYRLYRCIYVQCSSPQFVLNLFWHKKHEIGLWRFWPCLSMCLKEPTNLLPSTSVRDTKRKGSGLFEWFLCPPSHERWDMKAYCDLWQINVIILVVTVYWLQATHNSNNKKPHRLLNKGCQLLRHHQDDGWNMLKGLGIPTAKPSLFARIIASWEAGGQFFTKLPKGGCTVVQVRLHLKWWLNLRPNIFWWSKWRWKDLKVMNIKPVFRYEKSYSSLDDLWEIWNFVWKQSGASKNPPTTLLYTYIGWKIHHFGWYFPKRWFSSRRVSVPEGGYNVQSHFDTKWDIATVNPT